MGRSAGSFARHNQSHLSTNFSMINVLKQIGTAFLPVMFYVAAACGQVKPVQFGQETTLSGPTGKAKSQSISWINVNTNSDTWRREKELLICNGKPIGVMCSEKLYENFILEVEWKHLEAGGNSGIFVWSDAKPGEKNRLPGGVEVQMLELDWVKLNAKDGVEQPIAYVHGELFGVGGVATVPDNPRGERSKSIENRCKGKGEWNSYRVVCVDGTIKLSVNGKFVNGISKSTVTKGYLCLESEGAEIHFRNLRVTRL